MWNLARANAGRARFGWLPVLVTSAAACASSVGSESSDKPGPENSGAQGGSYTSAGASGGAAAGGTTSSAAGGSKVTPGSGGRASGGATAPASTSGGAAQGGGSDAGGEAEQAGAPSEPLGGSPNSGGSGTGVAGGRTSPISFGPYKDTSIDLDWNTNIISTRISGAPAALATELSARGVRSVTLAFATGECGKENWAGVDGASMALGNASKLQNANVRYILSTGGAAGAFTCSSDAGFATFLGRWQSPWLAGVDFDIEAGQSDAVISDLIARIPAARSANPELRFSLTLSTLANNAGGDQAQSLGAYVSDSLSTHGRAAIAAVRDVLAWKSPATWPGYLSVNLMVMDYGSVGSGVCVVRDGVCNMGESAVQAAHNLHDKWGVPYSNIELTPMIGGNDVRDEHFTLQDVDRVVAFVKERGLAGVHYWSYDRDVDCPPGAASPTCNSLGGVGAYGFLNRFLDAGLR
ncbi:MAG TPA: glycosyl hydrolase [Polyangiaceae bacterium]|nr:glycosyl hydrolase [Polyangiaceae bacterium]